MTRPRSHTSFCEWQVYFPNLYSLVPVRVLTFSAYTVMCGQLKIDLWLGGCWVKAWTTSLKTETPPAFGEQSWWRIPAMAQRMQPTRMKLGLSNAFVVEKAETLVSDTLVRGRKEVLGNVFASCEWGCEEIGCKWGGAPTWARMIFGKFRTWAAGYLTDGQIRPLHSSSCGLRFQA